MSSILNALKKVEADHDQIGAEYNLPGISGVKSGRRGWGSGKMLAVTISLALVIGFIFAVGILKMKRRTVTAAAKQPAVKAIIPVKRPVQKPAIAQRPVNIASIERKDRQSVPNRPISSETRMKGLMDDSKKVQKKPAETLEKRTPVDLDEESRMRPAPVEKEKRTPAPSQTPKPAIKRVAHPFRDDPRVELQALVWAPEPDARFVMINNQMVHEGGSSGNLRVLKINENDVLFSDGRYKWREKFKIN